MCIRDRATPTPDEATVQTAMERLAPLYAELGLQPQRPAQSVSYTHLRAHETVLDIVCRLLLDKKKQASHIMTTT